MRSIRSEVLPHDNLSATALAARLTKARAGLNALAQTLPENAWFGPYAATLNPPLWEYGHIAWFQEHWCLRRKEGTEPTLSPLLEPLSPSLCEFADWLYDSSRIPHAARWRAPLPQPADTLTYAARVLAAVILKLEQAEPTSALAYYAQLSLYHELMHTEAWWMMWQHHGFAPPTYPSLPAFGADCALSVSAGPVLLGSRADAGFIFDNEKWSHPVEVTAFEIDAHPVTCAAYADFIAGGGYQRAELWSDAGRSWLATTHARHPLYWRANDRGWQLRRFDRWIDLPLGEPVMHVSRYEAEAYCASRGRILPTAAQWLKAASMPGFELGRCWEWTCDAFAPYPGFAPDPYSDYSLPWFHTHAEVRGGGSLVTDAALARPTYRNFYLPERRDPFIGLRSVKRIER